MTEICTEKYSVNGHDVDRETSIKFLMARKFDVERAKTLFTANLVSYSLVVAIQLCFNITENFIQLFEAFF